MTNGYTSDNPDVTNTLRPRHNGRHFTDDIFKYIFLNEIVWIPIKISLKFVPKGPINYIPALVQIMAWRRPGDKSLSEPMRVRLLTHICVTRPQWAKQNKHKMFIFHVRSYLEKHIYVYIFFSTILKFLHGIGSWNLSLCKTRTCFSCLFSTIAADGLVMQESPSAMVLS